MIFGLDPSYTSWGPFIDHDTYQIQPVHRSDLITAAIAFTVCVAFAVTAAMEECLYLDGMARVVNECCDGD
jgi:hypothetical protein